MEVEIDLGVVALSYSGRYWHGRLGTKSWR